MPPKTRETVVIDLCKDGKKRRRMRNTQASFSGLQTIKNTLSSLPLTTMNGEEVHCSSSLVLNELESNRNITFRDENQPSVTLSRIDSKLEDILKEFQADTTSSSYTTECSL